MEVQGDRSDIRNIRNYHLSLEFKGLQLCQLKVIFQEEDMDSTQVLKANIIKHSLDHCRHPV